MPSDALLAEIAQLRTLAFALRWLLNMFAMIHACTFIFLSAALIGGGDKRFTAPAFQTARAIPYPPYTWGAVIGMCGIAVLIAIWLHFSWLRITGFVIASVWYAFFAITLYISIHPIPCLPSNGPCSAFTGIPTYTALSLLCAAHAGTSVILRRL